MLTIYSKPNCGYCEMTKQFLTERGIIYREIDIMMDIEARKFIQDRGHRSVPQIYFGNMLFVDGGYSGLSKMQTPDILHKIEKFSALLDGNL